MLVVNTARQMSCPIWVFLRRSDGRRTVPTIFHMGVASSSEIKEELSRSAAHPRAKAEKGASVAYKAANDFYRGFKENELPDSMLDAPENPKNNILLMTDGYKFSHHKQYPVSWMPAHARPEAGKVPCILYPPQGQKLRDPRGHSRAQARAGAGRQRQQDHNRHKRLDRRRDRHRGRRAGGARHLLHRRSCHVHGPVARHDPHGNQPKVQQALGLPAGWLKIRFKNVDESKLKRGSALNANYEGGYNVSYFTPRAYKDAFEPC